MINTVKHYVIIILAIMDTNYCEQYWDTTNMSDLYYYAMFSKIKE